MPDRPEFTDQDLGFIMLMIQKVDPTGIVDQCQTIKQKIEMYARNKQETQIAEAAATTEE